MENGDDYRRKKNPIGWESRSWESGVGLPFIADTRRRFEVSGYIPAMYAE